MPAAGAQTDWGKALLARVDLQCAHNAVLRLCCLTGAGQTPNTDSFTSEMQIFCHKYRYPEFVQVWVPSVYTSPALFLTNHPYQLGAPLAALIFSAGVAAIYINWDADWQRQVRRVCHNVDPSCFFVRRSCCCGCACCKTSKIVAEQLLFELLSLLRQFLLHQASASSSSP